MISGTALLLLLVLPVGGWADAVDRDAEALFKQGVQLFLQEKYKKSVKALEAAVRAAPGNSEYHRWLGRAYGRRAENISKWRWWSALSLAKKTRQSFERAVELDQTSREALSDLFEFYVEAPGIVGGGIEKAEKIAERLAALHPAAGERAWATIYEKRGEFEAAEAKLRRARELEPDKIDHLLTLAAFLARRRNYGESDELYRRATKEEPDSPEVWFSRAKALVRAERNPAQARSLLERYLKAEPRPDAPPRSQARKLLKQL